MVGNTVGWDDLTPSSATWRLFLLSLLLQQRIGVPGIDSLLRSRDRRVERLEEDSSRSGLRRNRQTLLVHFY